MSNYWIQTYTGKAFDLLNPDPRQVHIDDIAHALSNICRFNGHSIAHYSVAQHSVLLADQLATDGASIEVQRWALLHDAAEAYCGDIVRPLKALLPGFAEIEGRIMNAICVRFGMDVNMPAIVKEYDDRILADEYREVMGEGDVPWNVPWNLPYEPLGITIDPWPCWKAKRVFLQKFIQLFPEHATAYSIQQEVE